MQHRAKMAPHPISPTMKKRIFFAALCTLLSACTTHSFHVYYNTRNLPETSYQPLASGERPVVNESLDLQAALDRHLEQGYVIIGTMEMSGQHVSMSDLSRFACEKGASVVLYSSKRDGDITKSYGVPVSHTDYHSGTIYNGSCSASYTGSTTTTEWQTRTYTIGSYEQIFFFLAKKK